MTASSIAQATRPANASEPSDGATLVRITHGRLALAAGVLAACWFALTISGDTHYALEEVHHMMEAALIGLVGVQLAFALWGGVRGALRIARRPVPQPARLPGSPKS